MRVECSGVTVSRHGSVRELDSAACDRCAVDRGAAAGWTCCLG